MEFDKITINRLTIHKIYSKKDLKSGGGAAPYAENATTLCQLADEGLSTLADKIVKATKQRKRFFQLDIENTEPGSFWNLGTQIFGQPKDEFIRIANEIANKAAEAHDKGNIPGGLLLVAETVIEARNALIVIKAEKSNAFSLNGSDIQLVKDIFLSSDKTLYKIGFMARRDQKNTDAKAYEYYVYDDSFSPSKDDLAYYFYNSFLGYSTESNSKIQTNNFYNFIKSFVNDYIEGFDGQSHILNLIDQDMVSSSKKIIHPEEYQELFPTEIHSLFEEEIVQKLPTAIPKDTEVLSDIRTKRIKINDSALLITKNGIGSEIIIGSADDPNFETKKLKIDSGKKYIQILIPESSFDMEAVR